MCGLFASNLRTEQIVFIVSSETQLGGTFICLRLVLARRQSVRFAVTEAQSLREGIDRRLVGVSRALVHQPLPMYCGGDNEYPEYVGMLESHP